MDVILHITAAAQVGALDSRGTRGGGEGEARGGGGAPCVGPSSTAFAHRRLINTWSPRDRTA